jgi:hypothetical protein
MEINNMRDTIEKQNILIMSYVKEIERLKETSVEKIVYQDRYVEKIIEKETSETITLRQEVERIRLIIINYEREIENHKESYRKLHESYIQIESKYKETLIRIETIKEVIIFNLSYLLNFY